MANFATVHTSFVAADAAKPSTPAVPAFSATVPTTVQKSFTLATVNRNIGILQNPWIGRWWAGFGKPSPRSSFSLPTLISPVASPTDQTLFEEPQDATKKHYLTHYGIATQGSGSTLIKWVSFAPSSQGIALVVHLADKTDASLSAGNAPISPTATRYMLTANLQGRSASWDFNAATADGATLVLTLTLSSTDTDDRDSIYQAMTDPTANAQLIIRRSFDVAALVPPAPSAAVSNPPPPPVYLRSTTAIDSAIPFTFNPAIDKNVFQGLTGAGASGPVQWNIELISWQQQPYPYYQDPNQPAQIYFLPDAFKISRQPGDPHTPNIVISTNGQDPNTLTFNLSFLAVPVWDPNRLAAAIPVLQNLLGLPSPPSLSLFEASNTALALRLPASDPSSGQVLSPQPNAVIDIATGISGSVTLSMAQMQQVYGALFENVSKLLSGAVTVTVGTDAKTVPFTASAADFAGDIFDTTTSFDPVKNQLTAVLQNAIESPIHVASLPAVLMQGGKQITNVVQQITPSLPIDLTPMTASASGAASGSAPGSSTTSPGSADPPGSGTAPVPATSPAVTSLAVTLQLAAGQTIDSSCSVLFDFSHTTVAPDPDAIWEAIMQNQVVGPVNRNIKIMVIASVFTPPASSAGAGGSAPPAGSSASSPPPASSGPAASTPSAPITSGGAASILAVQVVFENGQTANFDTSTPVNGGIMTQTVSLAVPVKEYVLQVGDSAFYKYYVNLITSTGTQKGDWISSNQDSFYVQVGG